MLKRIGKQRYVLLPGRIELEPTGIRDRFRTENFYRKKIRYGLGSVKTVPLPALNIPNIFTSFELNVSDA